MLQLTLRSKGCNLLNLIAPLALIQQLKGIEDK